MHFGHQIDCLTNMKHIIIKFVRNIFKMMFYCLRVKTNKVLFINFNGKGYGCNPKYIAQEILNRNLNYDLVWLVKNLDEQMPEKIRKVFYGRIKALYEIATAKVIVTNVKNDFFLVKKKGQYVIQTWHGSYSSKLIEKEAISKLSSVYVSESIKNSKQTDLFLSNSSILSRCYRDSFWCECEIMECGFPRNDVLFTKNTSDEIKKIKDILGLKIKNKIVLYAPTFRDNGDLTAYGIDCDEVLRVLERFDDEWYFLIRMHPNMSENISFIQFNDKIINVSSYPDMQELLIISDILITDYSSTVFEFSAMGKPSYIFATDIEEYKLMRGLKDDFFDMPFPICENNDELIGALKDYDVKNGKILASKFIDIFGVVDNGTASEQVVDRIINIVESKW